MQCDICQIQVAVIDGRTKTGPWANMCQDCFEQLGCGLGLGKGQLINQDKYTSQAPNEQS